MAPILQLPTASEFEGAPHTLKSHHHTDPASDAFHAPQPEEEPTPAPQCQVCFDAIEVDTEQPAITRFCGAACPALLCAHCLSEHVRISLAAAFPGVLPKVKCPICLVPVHKSRWQAIATLDVLNTYTIACRKACSFQSPCCHNTEYTQLPHPFDAPPPYSSNRKLAPLKLVPSLKKQLEPLRQRARRFGNHKISSKELIVFLEDTFGRHVPLKTQHLLMEHLLARISDEERRATLLLSYHAKYKNVTTRCCGYGVCFNCKRLSTSHTRREGGTGDDDTGPCDEGDLDATGCVVECRKCHVTIVKVDGCDAVTCLCGFYMTWSDEVRLRDRNKKKLLPVDLLDIDLCVRWEQWHARMLRILRDQVVVSLQALRLRQIDQVLANTTVIRKPLRCALQKFLWRRRFTSALPQLNQQLLDALLERAARQLVKIESFMEPMRRWIWRTRWKKVVAVVRTNQFWLGYYNENRDELVELKNEEMAMLMPGMVTMTQ